MKTQRLLDTKRVTDYKTLTLELCDIYEPASKTSVAEFIGVSQKTIYNLIYGEPVGVYTKKKLGAFMLKEFGLQIKKLENNNIKLLVDEGWKKQETTNNVSTVDSSKTVNDLSTEMVQYLLSDNKELKRKLANLENENSSLTQEVIRLHKELIEMGKESLQQRFEKLDKKFSK